jgi:hypothetical protein
MTAPIKSFLYIYIIYNYRVKRNLKSKLVNCEGMSEFAVIHGDSDY